MKNLTILFVMILLVNSLDGCSIYASLLFDR